MNTAANAAPTAAPVAGGHAAAARRTRILVVDDQPINVQALYHALASEHQILAATSGEQALAVARDKQPDLILLDVVMPGIDGFETCRRLKAEPATRDIPVIFVTARSDVADEADGLDAGAVDFITKPVNGRIVRARVRTHVTLKQQADLLRRMAVVDGLTGVTNRRGFDERLNAEWHRLSRSGLALSIVMIDVDWFKRYNDRYGHLAGDQCLRDVAATLAHGLKRPADLLARYGGEEFVCLLPETDSRGALALATQLEAAVRALRIEHAESPLGVVTVSLGVASEVPHADEDRRALVQRADRALYHAKSQGRARASDVADPAA